MRREVFLLLVLFSAIPSLAAGRTWYVDAQGTGDAPTIQAGIDSAAAVDNGGGIALYGGGGYDKR